jgi:GDP-L-fucose synthase
MKGAAMLKDPFPTDGVRYYSGKRVTVTGASGLIGSYVVKLLKESGARVRAILHSRPQNDFSSLADEIRFADFSIPDSTWSAVGGSEIVIGCAGITGGVNLPKLDPVSYVGPATAMVINTLQACHEQKVARFGYLSSTTVYAPSDSAVKEDDVSLSDKLYPLYRGIGHSKRFLEKLCSYYCETTQLGVAVVRPSGAYGRFDNFNQQTSHVLPGLIERALLSETHGDKTFELWGDGQDVRDFIHAQDVARCLLMATADKPDAMPFNTASGKGITTLDLAKTVLGAVGISDVPVELNPSKPSALRVRLVNVDRAAQLLGFRAEISISDGVRDVVEWRRAQ